MIKKIIVLALLIFTLTACTYGTGTGTKTKEKTTTDNNTVIELKDKPVTGIDPEWYEPLGYYNYSPSAMKVSDTEMYVYYTRNEEIFNDKTDSIVVRKATLNSEGKWEYSDFKTVLTSTKDKNDWDGIYIFGADVIKGRFTYNGEQYSYLMAYCGSVVSGRMNSQIGLAVAKNPMDEFIKISDEPIIKYDPLEQSASGLKRYKGVQEPSLVSYDKKGKVQLFYSHYGLYNHSYCIEMDCSDLSNIKMGGRMLPKTNGLSDATTNTHFYSADWSYDPVNDNYYVVRNFSSTTSGEPQVAEAVQIVYSNSSALTETNIPRDYEYWKLINEKFYKIGAIKTSDDYSTDEMKWSGYYRVYNATVISDQYGWLSSPTKVEILFTSSALNTSKYLTGDEYKYSQMVHYYSVDIVIE